MTLSIDHEGMRLLAMMHDPLSLKHVKSIAALNSPLGNFLKAHALKDFVYRSWDFHGDSVIDDFWDFDADPTATSFTPSFPQVRGGAITGSTGATDNGALSMIGQGVVDGDNVAIMRVRFKLDVVTNIEAEIGFVDAITDRTLPAVGDIDTPANGSNGANDIAVFKFDTDQTLTTAAFVVDGVTSGMAIQKQNLGTFMPTAATYVNVVVGVYGNNAICTVNGMRSLRKTIDAGIEGGTLLRPWIYFRARSAAAKVPVIDFVELMGGR